MARQAAAFSEAVAARVVAEVRRRAEQLESQGRAVGDLGTADEVADRLLAALPAPSPWREIGPCYSTRGIAAVLGDVSRQAIEERRRRHTILALRTADGAWVYPAFQLDKRNQIVGGLADVVQALARGLDDWTVASLMLAAQPAVDGRSFIGALQTGDRAEAVAVARAAGERLAASA